MPTTYTATEVTDDVWGAATICSCDDERLFLGSAAEHMAEKHDGDES